MIFDEIAARYPGAFPDHQPRPRHAPAPDPFAAVHRHLHDVAEMFHAHLHHVQETIMSALDNLNGQADALEQAVDNTVIPALDALMAAAAQAGIPEADVQAATDRISATVTRLQDKAQEAAATVGGAG